MAKSIEEKAVDSLSAALSNNQFRYQEFCRLMSDDPNHKAFFQLMASYINYLAVFEQYGWYPNGTEAESHISARIVGEVNRLLVSP